MALPLIVVIEDSFEIQLVVGHMNNQPKEEVFSLKLDKFDANKMGIIHKVHFHDANLFKQQVSKSTIYIDQEIEHQYRITSMNLPWLLPSFSDKSSNNKIQCMKMFFYKLILQIVNYYYYIESAEEFSILDTVLETSEEKKLFTKKLMSQKIEGGTKEEDKIMEHIFIHSITFGVFTLNKDVFCRLYNCDEIKYKKLQKVPFIIIYNY